MTEHVAQFMSASPHTIQPDRTLSDARRWMETHAIRHLPVMDRGVLVGVISDRDIHLLSTVPGVNLDALTVRDAMTPDPYVVDPSASIVDVALEMSRQRFGSAIVVDKGHVVGVFTTVDALRVLALVLARK